MNRLLLIAALVLLIIGAVLGFGLVGSATVPQLIGLVSAGLACWVASLVA